MLLDIAGKTDKGAVRLMNQDAFIILELEENAKLLVVCDGMGGENGGEIASETAVNRLKEVVDQNFRFDMSGNAIRDMLEAAVTSANVLIHEKAGSDPKLYGMGTTIVACLIRDEIAYLVSVGDSRAYSFFEDKAVQITTDHSIVQKFVEEGKISEEEAKTHPKKHLITRALGVEETVLVDKHEIPFKPGEKILICTDGLSNYFDIPWFLEHMNQQSAKEVADFLVESAIEAGGADNVTAVVAFSNAIIDELTKKE